MKVVVTVVCQDCERHVYEHTGNVDTLRTLLHQLKVRHNPRMQPQKPQNKNMHRVTRKDGVKDETCRLFQKTRRSLQRLR